MQNWCSGQELKEGVRERGSWQGHGMCRLLELCLRHRMPKLALPRRCRSPGPQYQAHWPQAEARTQLETLRESQESPRRNKPRLKLQTFLQCQQVPGLAGGAEDPTGNRTHGLADNTPASDGARREAVIAPDPCCLPHGSQPLISAPCHTAASPSGAVLGTCGCAFPSLSREGYALEKGHGRRVSAPVPQTASLYPAQGLQGHSQALR